MHLKLGLLSALIWSGSVAFARWNLDSAELLAFRDVCRLHRDHVLLEEIPNVGALKHFPLGAIESAQARFAYPRALETLAKGRANMITVFRKIKRRRIRIELLPADNHHALFDLSKPAIGTFYRGKIYLNDGNHKAISSLAAGAKTLPVEVIKIWSPDDTPEAFQLGMERLGLGHWRDHDGAMMAMHDLCELINDPFLQLARLQIRRVTADVGPEATRVQKTQGGKFVNAIKINQDIPFFEIEYGDALHRAGETWDDSLTALNLDLPTLTRHLAIVRKAGLDPNSPLHKILVLAKPQRHDQIDYQQSIEAHVKTHGCADYLRHGVLE